MILSGRDIEWYIEKGLLNIDPVEKEQFQQNGVDLILASMEPDEGEIEPLHFYLGATKEILTLPDDLMGFVELRSSWG